MRKPTVPTIRARLKAAGFPESLKSSVAFRGVRSRSEGFWVRLGESEITIEYVDSWMTPKSMAERDEERRVQCEKYRAALPTSVSPELVATAHAVFVRVPR